MTRKLSADEVKALGLDDEAAPQPGIGRKLSAGEVKSLGLDEPRSPGPYRTGYEFAPSDAASEAPRQPVVPVPAPAGVPSLAATLGYGAARGVTAGLADRAVGALHVAGAYGGDESGAVDIPAPSPGRTARVEQEGREAYRAADTAAKKANPAAYGLATAAGALLPVGPAAVAGKVAGALGRGSALARGVFSGAAQGATQAAGESEAPTLTGRLEDAGKGALEGGAMGGIFHGISRAVSGRGAPGIVAGAPERADKALAGDLLERVPAKTQDKSLASLGGREGAAKFLRQEPALAAAAAKGPPQLTAALKSDLDQTGGRLGQIYKAVDQVSPGISGDKVMAAFDRLIEDARKAGHVAEHAALLREQEGIKQLWRGRGEVKGLWSVPAEQLHDLVSRYGSKGFEAGMANPTAAAQLGRDLNAEMRTVLQNHVEAMTKRNPSLGSIDELRALNARYSKLSALDALSEEQLRRGERNAPSLGDIASKTVKGAALIGAAVSGNVWPLAAIGGAIAAPKLGRAATSAMAKVVRAAREGSVPAGLVQDALENGVPRAIIQNVVSAAGGAMRTPPNRQTSAATNALTGLGGAYTAGPEEQR